MIKIISIALGGCIGAILRYYVTVLCAYVFGTKFPVGTLLVNVVGSFILGFFVVYVARHLQTFEVWRLFVGIGILGAFTTFSTFSFDTVGYLRNGEYLLAAVNIFTNNFFSILACYLGVILGKSL